MKRRFAFCYQMEGEAISIAATIAAHVTYWKDAAVDDCLGGPFADRSGGLITFATATLEEANRITQDDPFARNGLLRACWLREWIA
jgi:uncharacterized protein YciI